MPRDMSVPNSGNAPEPRKTISLGSSGSTGVSGMEIPGPISLSQSLGIGGPPGPPPLMTTGDLARLRGDGVSEEQIEQMIFQQALAQGPGPALTPGPIGPNAPTTAPTNPYSASSAPPAQPDFAAQLLAVQQQNEEILQALRTEQERREEMEFKLELANLSRAAAEVAPPDGLDLTAPATVGDLFKVAQNLHKLVPSWAAQTALDISPAEQQDALASHPEIAGLPEPARTQALVKAVTRLRGKQSKPSAAEAPAAPTSTPRATPVPPQARPAPSVVPLVEAGGPAMPPGDPQIPNLLNELTREYHAVLNDKRMRWNERKQRLRDVMDRIAQVQGYHSRSAFARGTFTQMSRKY